MARASAQLLMHSHYLLAPFGNCNIVVGFIGNAHLGNQFSGTSLIQRAPYETMFDVDLKISTKIRPAAA